MIKNPILTSFPKPLLTTERRLIKAAVACHRPMPEHGPYSGSLSRNKEIGPKTWTPTIQNAGPCQKL